MDTSPGFSSTWTTPWRSTSASTTLWSDEENNRFGTSSRLWVFLWRQVVRSGDDLETAVLLRALVDREPDGQCLQRVELPIGAVLVPQHGVAVSGLFADVVGQ